MDVSDLNIIPWCRRTISNGIISYEINGWISRSIITLHESKFNKEELDLLDDLIISGDTDSIILANQIILSKYD